MKSCFFIGHREASSEVLPALAEAVEMHITENGVTEFIVGNYGGFDHMAAKAVIAAKEQHPDITLSMLIPYHPAERPVETPQGFDNTFYPPGMEKVPRKLAIVRANRYMVDHSSRCVCFLYSLRGGTMSTVQYAAQKQLPIENLAMDLIRKPDGLLKEEPRWNCTFISRSAKRNAGTAHFHPFQIWTRKWVRMWMR